MVDAEVDVLIAGAGPVGLTAALQLARWGVSVRLVDAAPGPATTSRALGTHARSLEIYDEMGVLGDIAPHGTRVNAFIRHRPDGAGRVDFDFAGMPTRFPFMFNVDQVVTERVLRGHAAAAGVGAEWGVRLASFAQDDDGVTAVLESDAGATSVRARYLWGCDGGRSTVRKLLDLPLEGEPAETWLIADAVVRTGLDRDGVHWLTAGDDALMVFPFPDPHRWRLLDMSGEGDPDDPDGIAAQFSAKLGRALGVETEVERPTWSSRFTIQQRAVPAMHRGRCFVSGDAAHVHSPASGQGMNTGIQDAVDLAWKLAMVVRGEADPVLLETYDAERVPIGQALLASTGEVMAKTTTATAAAPPDAERRFAQGLIQRMSGLRIGYAASPLTVGADEPGPAPRPGERLVQVGAEAADSAGWTALRARLRSPAWHLLVFGEAAEAAAPRLDWLDVVEVARRRPEPADPVVADADGRVAETLGADADDWILVRPDGYLSARGHGAPMLEEALRRLELAGVGARRAVAA